MSAEKDTRCFEMRTYYANPGKLDALNARFRDHTCKLFANHGMENIGYWVPVENAEHKLIYLLAYPDREAREKAWKGFLADPDWQATYKASTAEGRLVRKVDSTFLSASDISPAIRPSSKGPSHVYELRTYQAAPDKLEALHARFRDHTIALFSKHGMTHFGYWNPMPGQNGAQDTLIYILAHDSDEARGKSFSGFRVDPDWVAAKAASEKGGSLTVKVESVVMKPTDYSPAQ